MQPIVAGEAVEERGHDRIGVKPEQTDDPGCCKEQAVAQVDPLVSTEPSRQTLRRRLRDGRGHSTCPPTSLHPALTRPLNRCFVSRYSTPVRGPCQGSLVGPKEDAAACQA